CDVAPGRLERVKRGFLIRRLEEQIRRAATSPTTLHGDEDSWFRSAEYPLLFGRKLDHSQALVGPDGGKDLASHSEVRMPHMGSFDCFGKTKSEPAKIVASHGTPLKLAKHSYSISACLTQQHTSPQRQQGPLLALRAGVA